MATSVPTTGALEVQPAAATRGWRAWRAPLLLALATVAALRLALSVWAGLILTHLPTTDLQTQYAHVGITLQSGTLAAPWEREDALWYEKIAAQGYAPNDGTTGFFPLLPLVMRGLSMFTLGDIPLAGILAGSLAAVAALALLYRLVARDWDAPTATHSVAYLALFPTAFFLYSAYTESLFLALTLGAFWLVREGRWKGAAALAALAGLTKVQGAFLGLPLLVEYLVLTGWRPRWPLRLPARRYWLGGAILALSGAVATGAFFAFLTYVVRDPLSWNERESLQWQQSLTWPGAPLVLDALKILDPHSPTILAFNLAVMLLFTGLTIAAFRLRLSYGLQAASILLLSWFHIRADDPLVSISRYVLVAFPCFLVLALWAGRRPRWVHLAIITVWVAWLLVWASQAVRGYWVA